MHRSLLVIEMYNLNGWLRMFLNLKTCTLTAIIEAMAGLVLLITGFFVPTVFCENRNLDVIKEAMHNELGYAVTDKYKSYTKKLVEAYTNGEELSNIGLISLPPLEDAAGRLFKNIDGIKFLNHQGGCGGIRQDAAVLSKLLAAYADHPNVAGVTVLSLGCQNLQVQDFKNDLEKLHPGFDKPLFIFEQQQSQSEEQLISEAIKKTFEGLIALKKHLKV